MENHKKTRWKLPYIARYGDVMGDVSPTMENQKEQIMENEMETGLVPSRHSSRVERIGP